MEKDFIGVYFNPKYNGLHVLHSIGKDCLVVGGCCNYLADAHTNIVRHTIKKEAIEDWIVVDESNLRVYPFISMKRKGIATGVKSRLKDKAYLFYKDPCVLKTEYLNMPNEILFDYWL